MVLYLFIFVQLVLESHVFQLNFELCFIGLRCYYIWFYLLEYINKKMKSENIENNEN